MRPTDTEVKEKIQIILSDRKAYPTSLNYAVNYCRFAMELTGEDLRTQCLYILNNITHWRHPQAKEVREALKSYTKN